MLTFYLQHIFKCSGTNSPFESKKKWLGIGQVQYRYFREVLERDWERRSKPM